MYLEGLNALAEQCKKDSNDRGFSTTLENLDQKLLLIVGEVIEAQEEIRAGKTTGAVYYKPEKPDKPEGFPIEIADALIRIFELCGSLDIPIAAAVALKMEYNKTRPYLHGKKF